MIDAIRSEWIKLRTVRSTILTFAVAVGLVVLAATYTALRADRVRHYHSDHITLGVTIAELLFGILGVQIIGQEYRFNTIRTTFTAVPNRIRVLAAKLVVIVLASAGAAIIMIAASLAIGKVIMGSSLVIDASDRGPLLGMIVVAVLWAGVGFAVGAIVRQPIAGILIVIIWPLVVEGIVHDLVPASRPWLPFLNGIQISLRGTHSDAGLRSPGSGAWYFLVFTVLLAAVGLVLAQRRDA
ncbi:MAG TPA: ABC transporter permease [Acidimicrobiales bacterium]